jgi:hypothetical protein
MSERPKASPIPTTAAAGIKEIAISAPIMTSNNCCRDSDTILGEAINAKDAAAPDAKAMKLARYTDVSVGKVLSITAGFTVISGAMRKKANVTKNAKGEPITSIPISCLAKSPPTVFHFLYITPMETALEGPIKGAMHMEPIITGMLLANKPPVARRADTTTRPK